MEKEKGIVELFNERKGQEDKETRTYTVSDRPRQLDQFETLLTCIEYLGNVGASRVIKLSIDGDGSARIKVEKDGKKLESPDKEKFAKEVDTGKREIYLGIN